MTDSTFNAKSMVARVLKDVLLGIASGEYAGTLPPQELLAKKLGVSRTVMREALVILRFCNVLVMRPKTGTTINARGEWKAALLEVSDE
jgi:DNA-binding FadR family transcriptional regulator